MSDVGLGELIVRMVVSLGIVLAIVFGAYALLRHRPNFGSGGGSSRSPRSSSGSSKGTKTSGGKTSGGKPSSGKRGLKIVGRIGVSRTSSVIAVQFAERVFLVGASDHTSPAVLAELSLDDWETATEIPEEAIPLSTSSRSTSGSGPRPSILDSLREATTRRA